MNLSIVTGISIDFLMVDDTLFDDTKQRFPEMGMAVPPKSSIHSLFQYKPSIFGYPYFRKPANGHFLNGEDE